MEVDDEEESEVLVELMTLVVFPMEMKEEEDDLGDLQGVGGCSCGDGNEGDGGGQGFGEEKKEKDEVKMNKERRGKVFIGFRFCEGGANN